MLTRLSPLKEDDEKGFKKLEAMLHNIDPGIKLEKSATNEIGEDLESFKKFYYNTFGIPGTPEFNAKIKEINKNIRNA